MSTADAKIILADIPVVRLRESLPTALLSGNASYSETVEQTQKLFKPASMTLDHATCTLTCHDTAIKLPPQIFALAAWMARQLIFNGPQKGPLRWDKTNWNGYIDEYSKIPHANQQTLGKLKQRFSNIDISSKGYDDRKSFFEENISRLRTHIRKNLGPLAPIYLPKKDGAPGQTTFTFPLPPKAIKFL